MRGFTRDQGTVLPASAAPSGRATLWAAPEFARKKLTHPGTDDAGRRAAKFRALQVGLGPVENEEETNLLRPCHKLLFGRCDKDSSGGERLDLHSVAEVGQAFDQACFLLSVARRSGSVLRDHDGPWRQSEVLQGPGSN